MTDYPQELNQVIHRVNLLGNASESLFSRLYSGLRRKSPQGPDSPSPQDEDDEIEEVTQLIEHNRQLFQTLRTREVEIERLNAILANLNDGIIMQDLEGQILLINHAARAIIGQDEAFWEAELARILSGYSHRTTLEHEVVPLGDTVRIEINKRTIGAHVAAVADANGSRIGTMIVLHDSRSESLASRLKDQFISAISHELRTPMTAIKGASDILMSGTTDAAINHRMLDTLTRNIDILDRMVIELLDISEISAGSFTLREDVVDLEELIWSVVHGMFPEIKRGRLDVQVMVRDQHRMRVLGDAQRLHWAFGHLVQNAVRYTESGGHIIVAAGIDERDDRMITLDVIDTGVGIRDKDLPHIFDRFYRGEARTPSGKLLDPRGLGQGLYIAQAVISAHKGTVSVQTRLGEGSVFTVMLPRLIDEE
jgi:two-component system phosphate regulon sensor histidine kinase PhoR